MPNFKAAWHHSREATDLKNSIGQMRRPSEQAECHRRSDTHGAVSFSSELPLNSSPEFAGSATPVPVDPFVKLLCGLRLEKE